MKHKICVITGSRAEYGLLYPLMKRLKGDDRCHLQVVAAGMHLSSRFGYTLRDIESDGFQIDGRVEMPIEDDSEIGVVSSIGEGICGFANLYKKLSPDMIVVLGDRYEIFSAAVAAHIARIPIAHIHGGEVTVGAIDEAFRHSITKMAMLHFTSTEKYWQRVIQLGEHPDRVYNVGALGLDNILNEKLKGREDLEKELDVDLRSTRYAMVTYHPVTLMSKKETENEFHGLLMTLDEFKDVNILFTMPNADPNGSGIARMIDEYTTKNSDRSKSFVSLGRVNYLSLLKFVDFVAGNSSSGIIEVPSFGCPTINIGRRQEGRVRPDSVIDCSPDRNAIADAIKTATSDQFRSRCKACKSPYGDGRASERIVEILMNSVGKTGFQKSFYDLKVEIKS